MKQIISALFLCMLLSAVPGLQAQNIQLHYDFGRSLYDKDLQGRPLLTSTVEKFHPDTWGKYLFLCRYGLYLRRCRCCLLGNSP